MGGGGGGHGVGSVNRRGEKGREQKCLVVLGLVGRWLLLHFLGRLLYRLIVNGQSMRLENSEYRVQGSVILEYEDWPPLLGTLLCTLYSVD